MAEKNQGGKFFDKLGGWLSAGRATVTWIYTSAILFPMGFAMVAALVLTFRHGSGAEPGLHRFFSIFYLALMVTLASVPRSIIPILIIWLGLARFMPAADANRWVRYAGLFLLMLGAVALNSVALGHGFSVLWILIGWLSLSLPRLAFPMLRGGLGDPAA